MLVAAAFGCGHDYDPVVASHLQATAVAVGAPAPDGELASASGQPVRMAAALHGHAQTIVVFYRGFF